jgi:hypothetical protein
MWALVLHGENRVAPSVVRVGEQPKCGLNVHAERVARPAAVEPVVADAAVIVVARYLVEARADGRGIGREEAVADLGGGTIARPSMRKII